MVEKLSKFDAFIQGLECQLLSDDEQLLLLAGKGSGVSMLGANNCDCANNCECETNNCNCKNNSCKTNNCECDVTTEESNDLDIMCGDI